MKDHYIFSIRSYNSHKKGSGMVPSDAQGDGKTENTKHHIICCHKKYSSSLEEMLKMSSTALPNHW